MSACGSSFLKVFSLLHARLTAEGLFSSVLRPLSHDSIGWEEPQLMMISSRGNSRGGQEPSLLRLQFRAFASVLLPVDALFLMILKVILKASNSFLLVVCHLLRKLVRL